MMINFPDDWGVRKTWQPVAKNYWDVWEVGTRVALKRDVDRFPSFGIVKAGKKGTIVANTESEISVKMDEYIEGAEEWNNCIIWYIDDFNVDKLGNPINPLKEISKDLKVISSASPSIRVGKKVRVKKMTASQLYDNAAGAMDGTVGLQGTVIKMGDYNGKPTALVQFEPTSWWYFIHDLEVI